MKEPISAQAPLEIDRIQGSRSTGGEIQLRLSGRWLARPGAAQADDELLVVQVEGRRHRFPTRREAEAEADRWSASVTVPAWAAPRQDGQAALWIGNAVVPVPPLHGSVGGRSGSESPAPRAAESALGAAVAAPELLHVAEAAAETTPMPPPAPAPPPAGVLSPAGVPSPVETFYETPRSGPLADLLLKETIAALHAELEQRSAETARMRGALADSRSELEARTAMQEQLEATLGALRDELKRLLEAVEAQHRELDQHGAEAERERTEMERRLAELASERDELATERDAQAAEVAALRQQAGQLAAARDERIGEVSALRGELATVGISRQAALSESAGLRSELERLGAELAVTRERVASEAGDLGEANRLLADAKALADELRESSRPG